MSDDDWQEWPYPGFGAKVALCVGLLYGAFVALFALACWLD